MEFYLIRHTPVDLPKGICYGQSDVGIDKELFKTYLSQLKDKLPKTPSIVFSSDLSRCTRLAQSLYPSFITDQRLREINFGEWELKKWDDIDVDIITHWSENLLEFSAKNGENLTDLYQRVVDFIQELQFQNHEEVVIVTHAGVIRCILTYLNQTPLEDCMNIPINFGEVYHIKKGGK